MIIKSIKKILSSLRIEEFIAFLFFMPMVYITFRAYFYFAGSESVPKRIIGGLQRLWIIVLMFLIFLLISKLKKNWRIVRDWLPFGFCIAIYTNLHDTIHFVNKNDIHDWLIKIDDWMFGVQPCVWVQKYIHPGLTDFFITAYANYFVLVICVALVLYVKKQYREFRYTLVTIILCYYTGYFLFVLFPAAPPRLVLKPLFYVTLHGEYLTTFSDAMISASSSRGAFPSLHCAVSFVSLFFAWRYVRWMFWLMIPMVVSLILSTIYLRHHYVIDLIAGLFLGIFIYWIGPKLEDDWQKMQLKF